MSKIISVPVDVAEFEQNYFYMSWQEYVQQCINNRKPKGYQPDEVICIIMSSRTGGGTYTVRYKEANEKKEYDPLRK